MDEKCNLDYKKLFEKLGINKNLDFELQMILFIFYTFNGSIKYEKFKNVCKECGFGKYLKDIELEEKNDVDLEN